MAKNVLFLIHGSGPQGDDWARRAGGPIQVLEQAAASHPWFAQRPLKSVLELVPIRYDDIFARILGGWKDMAQRIRDAVGGSGGEEAVNLAVDLTAAAGASADSFLRGGGDMLLYKRVKLFAQRVQIRVITRVAQAIAERTAQAGGGPARFSVAAAGLGTAVAHDALHLLGSEEWMAERYEASEDKGTADAERASLEQARGRMAAGAGGSNPFSPKVFRFDSLFMMGNTSALLSALKAGPYNSLVRPSLASGDGAYARFYYNFIHRNDPLARVSRFAMPQRWKDAKTAFEVGDLDHYYQPAICDLGHYLIHPRVHMAVLANSVDGFQPGDEDLRTLADFNRWGPGLTGDPGHALEDGWRRLANGCAGKSSLGDLVRAARDMRDLAAAPPAANP
jgi:hypothetical protein